MGRNPGGLGRKAGGKRRADRKASTDPGQVAAWNAQQTAARGAEDLVGLSTDGTAAAEAEQAAARAPAVAGSSRFWREVADDLAEERDRFNDLRKAANARARAAVKRAVRAEDRVNSLLDRLGTAKETEESLREEKESEMQRRRRRRQLPPDGRWVEF